MNKGVIWEKVWAHPLILSACRYIFNGDFKVSSLNAREALYNGGHQPLHADWKSRARIFPKSTGEYHLGDRRFERRQRRAADYPRYPPAS